VEDRDALYGVLPLDDRLIIHTNEDAPGYRVLSADPADPGRDRWKELIPEGEDVLQIADVAGGKIFATFLKDAASVLRVFSLEGEFEGEVPVPPRGTVYGFNGEISGDEIYLGYISFTVAPRIYRYRIPERELSLWQQVPSPVPEGEYETVQVRCTSRDGTRVPVFIIHRKGIPLDGSHPALLTGYGGFSISLTPSFDRESFLWLENGGVLAVANLRGGGEFGEAWHRAGTLERKQNVFDDFIAAAEHLCREGYTGADRLAIKGGSNGGLLVGAALTQRPDLFRAVVCRVPLLDMIRYQHFRIARLWISEYGSSEDAGHLRWLLDYSPYHSVRERGRYPSVLLTTAESDSRVDPMHARKMAARLQAAQAAEDRPILLRVETRAGHGAGKPLSKQLEEQLDIWTFLFREMGMESSKSPRDQP
jgi:prolyl oligopeptidase